MPHAPVPLSAQRHAEAQTMAQQLLCLKIVQQCTAFVDEVQRERGLAQLALSTHSPCYRAAWSEQMHLTDEAQWALEQLLPPTDENSSQTTPAGWVFWHGPEMRQWRQKRRERWHHPHPTPAGFDTDGALVQECLLGIQAWAENTNDSFLRSELAHLSALMWCKEHCAQERALGLGLFGSGRYQRTVWQAMATLGQLQQEQASRFMAQARPGLRQQWHVGLHPHTQAELEHWRHTLSTHSETLPLDTNGAEVWFRVCSQRMCEWREIERQHLEQLTETLTQRWHWLHQAPTGRTDFTASPGIMRTVAAWWLHASGSHPPANGMAA